MKAGDDLGRHLSLSIDDLVLNVMDSNGLEASRFFFRLKWWNPSHRLQIPRISFGFDIVLIFRTMGRVDGCPLDFSVVVDMDLGSLGVR